MDLEILFKLVWTHITVYTGDSYEDEAGYALQPTQKHLEKLFTHQLAQKWFARNDWLWYESHSLSAMSHDNELESADKTGNWNTL